MVLPLNGFPKSQRLKSRKKLQQLFTEGKSLRVQNVRIVYTLDPSEIVDFKCGVGLVTKHFKNATDRNRIKRLLREAFRLQRTEKLSFPSQTLSMFILYTGKELPAYQELYHTVGLALQKLSTSLHAATT